jgi:hypothetical protein
MLHTHACCLLHEDHSLTMPILFCTCLLAAACCSVLRSGASSSSLQGALQLAQLHSLC